MRSNMLHRSVEQQANRAVLVFLGFVVALGTPVIVAIYLVDPSIQEGLVLLFMFVPAFSAILARLVTRQRITFGKPSAKTLLLAFIPPLAVGAVYGVLALIPGTTMEFFGIDIGISFLLIGIAQATAFAFGEELGWRGYLLPQLRRTRSFFVANVIVLVIWFAYHVPVIFAPGLYSNPGIPLWANLLFFAMAITGFSFFVGILWEKHHDVWAPTLAHGAWNFIVQSALPLMFFASSPWLMGEFGIVAALTTIAISLLWISRIAKRYRSPLEV